MIVVETVTFGLAALPALLLVRCVLVSLRDAGALARTTAVALSLVPGYMAFALALCALSAWGTRLLGWRTPPPGEWKLRNMEWPVMAWCRYMASTHLVRVCVGTVFRSSPLWTWYLRWNGARIGRAVYLSSTSISDQCMLDLGDGVVIGESVHLSAHTVEGGIVKTGRVRLGRFVTVGLGSVVGIDVEVGEGCQIGALSVVPKHSRLQGNATYVGAPATRVDVSPATRLQ